jgi:Lar family restriction alleviation protein
MTTPSPSPLREEIALLPCPFCGSDKVGLGCCSVTYLPLVTCRVCFADGPRHASDAEAVKAWNRRAALPALASTQALLEEAVDVIRPFAKGWWRHQNPNAQVWAFPSWSAYDKRPLCSVGDIQHAYDFLSKLENESSS